MSPPKRDSRLLFLILFGSCLILAVTYLGRLVTKATLDAQIEQKQAEIVAARENQQVLEAEWRYVQSEAYLQEKAHDDLNLAKPDEEIIVVVTMVPPTVESTPASEPAPAEAGESFWQRWLARLGFS